MKAVAVKPARARVAIAEAKLPDWARLGSPEEIHRSLAISIIGVFEGWVSEDDALIVTMLAEEKIRAMDEEEARQGKRAAPKPRLHM